jgi:hypothetical protein
MDANQKTPAHDIKCRPSVRSSVWNTFQCRKYLAFVSQITFLIMTFKPWRWRPHVPLKRRYPPRRRQGVTAQKTNIRPLRRQNLKIWYKKLSWGCLPCKMLVVAENVGKRGTNISCLVLLVTSVVLIVSALVIRPKVRGLKPGQGETFNCDKNPQ